MPAGQRPRRGKQPNAMIMMMEDTNLIDGTPMLPGPTCDRMRLRLRTLVRLFSILSVVLCWLSIHPIASAQTDKPGKQIVVKEQRTIPLAGTWRFALDPDDVGVHREWFSKTLDDTVRLPGTTDENHKGVKKDEQRVDRLSRVWFWKGPAWYQRSVEIPDAWEGKRITLFLERSKTTRVWVDKTFCGWENTLSAPQVFGVTRAMTPGEHTITVLVDNAKMPPVGPSHAVDERTQTNWNGIIGRMELRATDPVWIDDLQVYPNAETKEAVIRATIGNITGKTATGKITVACWSDNVAEPATFKTQTIDLEAVDDQGVVEFTYQPGDDVPLWDEFQPAMLKMQVDLETTAGGQSSRDRRSVSFGMRDFSTDRNRMLVNGRPVFLRGKLDCCFFPLTGYPPMDKDGWLRVLSISKSYGINHYRFHSWCPPKAAFEAADELGIYFQAELPNKRSAFNAPENQDAADHNIDRLDVKSTETEVTLYDYGKRESELIFRHFGNHPSFVTYTLGNELGRNQGMFDLIDRFQQTDPRRLYAQASNQMHWNPSLAEGDDVWVGTGLKDGIGNPLPLRGGYWVGDWLKGHIDGSGYRNDYPVWVYPTKAEISPPEGVIVTDSFAATATQQHLASGGKVLLLPNLNELPHSIEGAFQTGFWSPMFAQSAEKRGIKPPAGTEGILCDPDTPALAEFPTEFHSNWQWWQLVKNSRPIILDDTPVRYRPTVQVIDNFVRNHKLGLIFETKVGDGKILVCAIDLPGHQDKPEARQLLHSLLQYIDSKEFSPEEEIDIGLLKKLLPGGK